MAKEQALEKTNDKSLVQQKYESVHQLLEKTFDVIKNTVPKTVTAERISRIALTEIRKNEKLLMCSNLSLIGAVLQAAQLGLEFGPLGLAYLVPRRNKNVWEAQFQLGYQGIIELFYRHPDGATIFGQDVRENDTFEIDYGSEKQFTHKPAKGDRGDIIGYWVLAKMKSGHGLFGYMTVKEIDDHGRKFSDTFDASYSPWKIAYDQMALKTVFKKKLSKWIPKSSELRRALEADETIKYPSSDIVEGEDIIDMPDVTDWQDFHENKDKDEKVKAGA